MRLRSKPGRGERAIHPIRPKILFCARSIGFSAVRREHDAGYIGCAVGWAA